MNHSQTLQIRRRKKRAQKDRELAARKAKKLRNQNAKAAATQ